MSEQPFPAMETHVLVLHEACGVVAIQKPAGLATQAVAGIDSMELRVRRMLKARGEGEYLGIPHRLDRCVSGVMLFATTRRAARKLSRQFERRQIRKRYLALVEPPGSGILPKPGEVWVDLVAKLADEPRGWIASAGNPAAKEARTQVAAVGRHQAAVTLQLEPLTGRMHQLRIQAACRGMPIVGDRLYGSTRPLTGSVFVDDPRQEEIALAAISIEFVDPGEPNKPGSQVRRRVEAWPWWATALERNPTGVAHPLEDPGMNPRIPGGVGN
jgi:23S rRNA pseudouridine1911/1915/1917 synthase